MRNVHCEGVWGSGLEPRVPLKGDTATAGVYTEVSPGKRGVSQ